MSATYTGILRNNQIEWITPAPNVPADGVRVRVTLLESMPAPTNQGEKMAQALARLATNGGIAAITDPAAWERESRQDRELPGRD